MIVVDSSAIFFAILNAEPLMERLAVRLRSAGAAYILTTTWIELFVVGRLGREGAERLRQLALIADLRKIDFDAAQAEIAIDAAREFGRGSGSPARLNLGDCFSYALAKSLNLPLLYIGDDFVYTDIRPALAMSE